MKNVPYHANPGNACALACYTMVAQYLLPDKRTSFEELAKLAEWKKGYLVWGFSVWEWLMNQGVHMIDYDVIDYEAWAKDGVEGLRKSVPVKEFKFYKDNTFDLELESKKVNLMLNHSNFTYVRRKPTWADVVREHEKPGVCDVTLNSRVLNQTDGFSLHRVALLDITDTKVVFNDPDKAGKGAGRRESLAHFRKSFEDVEAPELARYYV